MKKKDYTYIILKTNKIRLKHKIMGCNDFVLIKAILIPYFDDFFIFHYMKRFFDIHSAFRYSYFFPQSPCIFYDQSFFTGII